MAAKQFNPAEWKTIREALRRDPEKYGLPKREYGSVLLASFNIRKLGSSRSRNSETWDFLAEVCRSFDLLAVQEIMDDLNGLRRLMKLLGPEFHLIVSDQTGKFPGEPGLGERMGFIYRSSIVERTEVATDITYDRTKIFDTIAKNYDVFSSAMGPYAARLKARKGGRSRRKPTLRLPIFLTFIRQPFCVSFRIAGHPRTQPYEFMAINAHLNFGDTITDRRQEFNALMDWIKERATVNHRAYYPNFILLGDLNLDFNRPSRDRPRLERRLKKFNNSLGEQVNVYFPFLDPHPTRKEPFKTNARLSETFDQIGLFNRDPRLPTFKDNATMGQDPRGPDYGVFEFVNLFSDAVLGKPFERLSKPERKDLLARFEHKVSDHMPLWLRLPLPEPEER